MINEGALLDDVDVQYYDDDAGWTTILPSATKVAIRRGGDQDGLKIKTDTGTASILLLNDQDPLDDGVLTTGMRIRIVLRADNARIFTGTILDVAATYPLNKGTGEEKTLVTVFAVDAVYPLTNTRVSGNDMFYETETESGRAIDRKVMTLEERVSRLAATSPVPIAIPQAFDWETVYELPGGQSIDGWTMMKQPPETVLPAGSSEFIQKGSAILSLIDPEEGVRYTKSFRALSLSWKTTGPAYLAKGEYGIQKTISVVPGQLYEFTAGINSDYNPYEITDQNVRAIRLAVDSVSAVSGTKLFTPIGGRYAPSVSFKAISDEVTLKVYLDSNTRALGPMQVFSAVDIFDIKVKRVETAYPQMLAWSMQDATLDGQLDLAANSVASHWYPDANGTIRLAPPSEYLPVSHTFSDQAAVGELNYVDVEATHDTKDLVNYLTIRNQTYSTPTTFDMKTVRERLKKAVDSTQKAENTLTQQETTYVWADETSIAKYGVRATEIQTNLQLPDTKWLNVYALDESGYNTVAYFDLLDKLTGQRQNPRLIVRKVKWNAQQDIAKAKSLELGQRVVIKYRGFEQDALIAGLEHDITPSRWMITVTLARP